MSSGDHLNQLDSVNNPEKEDKIITELSDQHNEKR